MIYGSLYVKNWRDDCKFIDFYIIYSEIFRIEYNNIELCQCINIVCIINMILN